MELEARKAVLYSIFDAGVRAVAPDAALMRHVCLEGDSLLVDGKRWPLPRRGRLLVLGAGKGVAPMGAAVEELLGDRIHSGLLVVKYGHGLPLRQSPRWRPPILSRTRQAQQPRRHCWSWPPGRRQTILSSVCSQAGPVP